MVCNFLCTNVNVRVSAVLRTSTLRMVLRKVTLRIVNAIRNRILRRIDRATLVVILVSEARFLNGMRTNCVLEVAIIAGMMDRSVIRVAGLRVLIREGN